MDLSNNYFQALDLPEGYKIDHQVLRNHYHQLQKECHPDKFVGKGSQQLRLAEQYTVFLNQAYNTLGSPLLRAEYLLTLRGVDCNFANTTHQDNAFLMEQMTLQESLQDIRQSADQQMLEMLKSDIGQRYRAMQDNFAEAFEKQDFQDALACLAKMHFFNKLQKQIEDLEEELEIF